MASIKKRPNGTYQATIYVGRDANGKQKFAYVTRPTLKECKAAAREIEQEIEEGRYINLGNMRLSTWIDKWLELNKARLAPSTYVTYKYNYAETHFKPYFGQMTLKQLDELHIREYISDKLKELSSTTVRKHFLVLRRILEDRMKHKNPAKDIPVPKADDFQPHVVTTDEFEVIRNIMRNTKDGLRNELVVLLAGWCGLRRGEIFALKWNDIDWDKLSIRVDESRTISEDEDTNKGGQNTFKYIDKDPKSKNSFRTVATPEELLNMLKEYRNSLKVIDLRIFPIRPDTFSKLFSKHMEKHGLGEIRFHDLRHYHSTWMYEQGLPDHYAAKRMGHDIYVLKRIYQHLKLDKEEEIDNHVRDAITRTATKRKPNQN